MKYIIIPQLIFDKINSEIQKYMYIFLRMQIKCDDADFIQEFSNYKDIYIPVYIMSFYV